MKVSLNWVKQFTDIDVSNEELIKTIGEQLGAVEEVFNMTPVYKDVLIAEVVECDKHPNADKLSLCLIDDGGVNQSVNRNEDGLIQVVCGANNVKKGIKVAWLPPGSTVPSSFHGDPFVLEARELRGKMSNGMIASMKELAIGDEHDGILIIDVESSAGQKFADVYQLNDTIIDIENKMFTHRPDCFGQLGVAREIAGITNNKFVSPDWYLNPLDNLNKSENNLSLKIINDIPDLVPRFVCVPIANVNIAQSPVIIQSFLYRVGIKPINNIVDITNYIMALTGQPLHAYDYDKLSAATEAEGAVLTARHGNGKESVNLLNGKTITPRESDIVIATDKEIVGIGGVMGGTNTQVDADTKNIVIECANFDMYAIRKTSMALGLFTDAVTRFNKGQSALQNETVLLEAMSMIVGVASGDVSGEIQNANGEVSLPSTIEVDAAFISDRLGVDILPEDVKRLLTNVEFEVQLDGAIAKISVPFWRTDIEIREDIVEEIGRLMGFHSIPKTLPMRDTTPVKKDRLLSLKSLIRNIFSSSGGNELLTYSFVHGKLLQDCGQDPIHAYKLGNALSPDLQYYRLSLTPSVLDKVYGNIRAGYDDFMLYEIGKTHIKNHADEESLPKEQQRLSSVVVSTSTDEPAYYLAQKQLMNLLEKLGIKGASLQKIGNFNSNESLNQLIAPFDTQRSAIVILGDEILGVIGEFTSKTKKALKLPDGVAGFELSTTKLLNANKFSAYTPLSKFPSVHQDISFDVPEAMTFGELDSYIRDNLPDDEDISWQLSPLDIYKAENKKHMSFRITISHNQKTLTSEEVQTMLDKIAEDANSALDVTKI